MISAFLQIEGILNPGNVLLAHSLEGGRSKILFRLPNAIDRGRSVVLQTSAGECLECVTTECTPEEDYHLVELRCMGDPGFLGAPPARVG